MPRVKVRNRPDQDVPPCLAYGAWTPPIAGEQHRHICMLDQGHDGPHYCVWHSQDEFEAVGYLDQDILP